MELCACTLLEFCDNDLLGRLLFNSLDWCIAASMAASHSCRLYGKTGLLLLLVYPLFRRLLPPHGGLVGAVVALDEVDVSRSCCCS